MSKTNYNFVWSLIHFSFKIEVNSNFGRKKCRATKISLKCVIKNAKRDALKKRRNKVFFKGIVSKFVFQKLDQNKADQICKWSIFDAFFGLRKKLVIN